ncbi:MAG: hypothetical protein AAGI08_14245 [Bacteroidota bacterium]
MITRIFAPLVLLAFLVSGCASTKSGIDPQVITGDYTFTSFTVRPEPAALDAFSLLGNRVSDDLVFRVFENNRLTLERRNDDTTELVWEGEYEVDGRSIKIEIADDFRDQRRRLFMPERFRLDVNRDGDALTSDISRDGVDMSKLSDDYEGLDDVPVTLEIRLARVR